VTLNVTNLFAPATTINYNAPVVDLVNPPNGATGGKFNITITGSQFGTLATVTVRGFCSCRSCRLLLIRVLVDGVLQVGLAPCPVKKQTQVQIICTLSPGSGSTNPVVVTVSGQSSHPTANNFAYNPPKLTAVRPSNGPIDGGKVIALYGENTIFCRFTGHH
jgi:hypothetical protein